MRLRGHVACMGGMKHAYKILLELKGPLAGLRINGRAVLKCTLRLGVRLYTVLD
jgi:hypothetical protein